MSGHRSFAKLSLKDARRDHKPKGWSHQDELNALIGKQVVIADQDGGGYLQKGALLAADQFSLKVELGCGTVKIFFKSGIGSFWAA